MSNSQSSPVSRVVRAALDSPRPGAEPAVAGAALRAIEEARPARTAGAGVLAAGGVDADAALRLRGWVAELIGDRPDRWLGVHDALAGHRGTLPALLAEIPPPAPPAAPGEVRAPAPRSVHTTLALLLEHARPEWAAAALSVLPARTRDALLGGGPLPAPALVTAVVDHGDAAARAALAGHPRLDARILARLLAVGDAAVAAAVYRNPRATTSLRRAVVGRLAREPMDEGLRAELTDPARLPQGTWLTPLLASGDPELTLRALRTQQTRGTVQRYALARVWETAGPDALKALLDGPDVLAHLTVPVCSAVRKALAEEDGSGNGLRRLREGGEPYEDPARLPALLAATRGTSSLAALLSEPYAHDMDALAEAHAKSPFMPKACEELARHEAADDARRLVFRLSVLNEPWRTGGRRAGNSAPPERRLAAEELDDSAAKWAEGMAAAGLLDPVELIRTARPAVHAVAALARLTERNLLTGAALDELRALTAAHLGERPEAWAALDTGLPGHGGTLAELITRAGEALPPTPEEAGAAEPRPEQAGPAAPAWQPPETPENHHHRAALAALDLLHSLAPAGTPLPADPAVLGFLAEHRQADAPGLATPAWLARACAEAGVEAPRGGWHTAPTPEEIRAERPRTWGNSTWLTEHAYAEGLLPAEELVRLLPARGMLLLAHDWRRMAFVPAWRKAVADLLRVELGTDPDGWLRLARTATLESGIDRHTDEGGPTWPELLEASRAVGAPPAGHLPADHLPSGRGAWGASERAPGTPDEALRLLEKGSHRWAWPVATLLCLADADVVDAVLPRLGPDGPWLLAAYLMRHDRTPRVLLGRLLAGRDPAALRLLAAQSRRLTEEAGQLLADLDDPETDLALLRSGAGAHLAARIVGRPHDRTAARVLAWLAEDPSARVPGGARWLHAREPGLIEAVFARHGDELGFAQQAVGCLSLLEHGGAARLTALVGEGRLGQAAAKLCVKALGSPDPAAVLRARVALELAQAKLLTRLRKSTGHWQTTGTLMATPGAVDWEALAEAHEEDPIPNWKFLVNLRSAPAALRLRYASLLHEPGAEGLPDGPETTRARARHGLTGLYHCPPVVQLDGLLASGHLTGEDLLHTAAPAARILAYLSTATRRPDAPAGAARALAGLGALIAARLAADPGAWPRAVARLTGRDPLWDPVSPVSALLA
ncbi:hypothetical protein [Streptomyces sp. NPDC059708]|uniref:hypothetical protein n=1 Tax=Streptomyces sp. NPDC059708 TaxID=3346916 RepID=UPI0036C84507